MAGFAVERMKRYTGGRQQGFNSFRAMTYRPAKTATGIRPVFDVNKE